MINKFLFFGILTTMASAYTPAIPHHYITRRNALYLTTAASLLLPISSNATQPVKPVCVIGASGETGLECVKILAQEHQPVRAVSRKSIMPDLDQISQSYVSSINADIKDPAIIDTIIKGTSSVIFLANAKKYSRYSKIPQSDEAQSYEDIDVKSLDNIVHSCIKYKIPRLVYVSASCRSCLADPQSDTDKMCGIKCYNCRSKQRGEQLIRKNYKNVKSSSYTIIRIGFLINGVFNGGARGVNELEINQDYTKSGMISKYDLASLCINTAKNPKTASTTFEAYYRDTTQPYEIQESLNKCTSMDRSMEECFFGSEYKNRKPKSLEEVQRSPTKGSIFTTGFETSGETWDELFSNLKQDVV